MVQKLFRKIMRQLPVEQLNTTAKAVRRSILEMIAASNSSHIAAAYSITDILVALYFGVLKLDPKNPKMPERDRFILSKGHGGAALYATLANRGFAPLEQLKTFAQNGSALAGHIVKDSLPGIETTAGSLGHGLGLGLGMAMALKGDKNPARVFVIIGDGESNEGSIWEAALMAPQLKLRNLITIVDYNKQQSLGASKDILNLEPLPDKWKAFGWEVLECDGHNIEELQKTLAPLGKTGDKPFCVIAHTTKGKGVSYMEQDPLAWHYKTPKDDLLAKAREELS